MPAAKDPYQILGVSKSATQDEIKNAYRGLAKKLHPDLNPGNKIAETKFKEVASAYEQVGTAEARTKFDRGETPEQQNEQARRAYEEARTGQGRDEPFYYNTQQGGGRYSSAFGQDMGGEEFFENLFRSAGRSRGRKAEPAEEDIRGEDQLYQMEIDFKDSVLGAEREITLPQGKKLKVKIPAGVVSGMKLRFKNQGGAGHKNGSAGDAYVEIKVRPSTDFKRVENDLETEISVSFIEALIGAEIQVPTIDGTVMLKVPPGVTTGSRLRVRGKGVVSGSTRGDQIVVLKVMTPKTVDPDLQAAIRDWNGKFSYNPRVEK
jgi:DnaJ-class molecular chaperone